MAMRVTSSSDQLRIAVTECREARSLCANNIVAEIASAAKGFIASDYLETYRTVPSAWTISTT